MLTMYDNQLCKTLKFDLFTVDCLNLFMVYKPGDPVMFWYIVKNELTFYLLGFGTVTHTCMGGTCEL